MLWASSKCPNLCLISSDALFVNLRTQTSVVDVENLQSDSHLGPIDMASPMFAQIDVSAASQGQNPTNIQDGPTTTMAQAGAE